LTVDNTQRQPSRGRHCHDGADYDGNWSLSYCTALYVLYCDLAGPGRCTMSGPVVYFGLWVGFRVEGSLPVSVLYYHGASSHSPRRLPVNIMVCCSLSFMQLGVTYSELGCSPPFKLQSPFPFDLGTQALPGHYISAVTHNCTCHTCLSMCLSR
jgi:hypothetical protein